MSNTDESMFFQMPDEVVNRTSKKQLAQTIVLVAVLALVANALAGYYLRDGGGNLGYALVKQKWELLQSLDDSVDLLVLGDSTCNQGVIPDVLDRKLGVSSANLCTYGDLLAVDDAWMLDYVLEGDRDLKAVVLVHAYDTWSRSISEVSVAEVPLSWGFWNRLEPQLDFRTKQYLKLLLGRYFHLFSQNRSLQTPIMNWWRHEPIQFDVDSSGFMAVVDAQPNRVEQDAMGHLQFVRNQSFSMSAENRLALEHIQDLAVRHDFQVFLFHSPVYAGLYTSREFKAYLGDVNNELAEIASRNERFTILETEPVRFERNEMENADHVTLESAQTFSSLIADKISQQGGL